MYKIDFAIKDCWKKADQASECLDPLYKRLEAFEAASKALQGAIIKRGVAIGAEKGQAEKSYDFVRSALSSVLVGLCGSAKRAWSRLP